MRIIRSAAIGIITTSAWLLLPLELLFEVGVALIDLLDLLLVLGPLGVEDPTVAGPDVAMNGTLSAWSTNYTKVGQKSILTTKWVFFVVFGFKYSPWLYGIPWIQRFVFSFIEFWVWRAAKNRERFWLWQIWQETLVHLGHVDDWVWGSDLHNGLGDSLLGGHEVVHVLPHGEQVRGNCSLDSLLGFLLPFPLRLSSIENIIRCNAINYLEDWLEKDCILQLPHILFRIRVSPLRQVVFSKGVRIWWNVRGWCRRFHLGWSWRLT